MPPCKIANNESGAKAIVGTNGCKGDGKVKTLGTMKAGAMCCKKERGVNRRLPALRICNQGLKQRANQR